MGEWLCLCVCVCMGVVCVPVAKVSIQCTRSEAKALMPPLRLSLLTYMTRHTCLAHTHHAYPSLSPSHPSITRHILHTAVLPRVQPRGLRAEDRQGPFYDTHVYTLGLSVCGRMCVFTSTRTHVVNNPSTLLRDQEPKNAERKQLSLISCTHGTKTGGGLHPQVPAAAGQVPHQVHLRALEGTSPYVVCVSLVRI